MYAAARLYDVIHVARGKDYVAESQRVRELILARHPNARRLLDVACGTAGHLEAFAKSFEAEGVDLSKEMLTLAAEKRPDIPLHLGDMRTFDLGTRFDAVVCLFSSIGYLLTMADLGAGIANMARHLVGGGVLVVEPWIHPEHWRNGTLHVDTATTEDLVCARLSRSWTEGAMSAFDMRYVVATTEAMHCLDEHHRMALYTVDEYLDAFGAAGLAVEHDPVGLIGRGLFIGVKP